MNRFKTALKLITTRASNVNLAAANNLFGSIASSNSFLSTNMGFVPSDGNGGTIDISMQDVEPQWLGLRSKYMQYWAYNYCSPLAAVIDRLAEADTNGKIEFLNEDGTTKTNVSKIPNLNKVARLLRNPNPLQTWHEFNSEQVVYCKTFGYCPVFAICPAGMDKTNTKYLFNLNPYKVTPVQNPDYSLFGNSGDSLERENPILKWEVTVGNISYSIPAQDIILIKDGYINSNSDDFGLPVSKVAGLDYFVSNICAAMEADNVLLKKKGPLGVFSHDPKPDMAGWLPLTPEQKDDIQKDLKNYGLTAGQLQYVISKTPLKWNAMSFNLRDLMTKETVRQGIDGICDRFGYPAELMSGKNATYENRNSAEKFLYQNNVIPFSLRRMERYCSFFGIEGLVLDYDHLPVLQEDIMSAGQARKSNSESIDIDWKSGRLTWNECRVLQDMDTKPGMDIYYNEYLVKFPAPAPPANTVNTTVTKTKKDAKPAPKNT